jgi:hypothetical protein
MVRRPPEIEIIRRAYELWELSGKPEGRDQELLPTGSAGVANHA